MTTGQNDDGMLMGLNPGQLEAVTYGEGPLLVLAGAGSGKTRVLTHRIAWLVLSAGVDPRRILALTFTNKAANEMKERVERLLGSGSSHVWLGTFHSIALRILRRHTALLPVGANFAVYDTDDQKRLGRRVIEELRLDPKKHSVTAFLSIVSREKDEGRGPEHALPGRFDAWSEAFRRFYGLYQDKLLEAHAMDFGDLLSGVLSLFARHPEVAQGYAERFQHLLIDEYQDTNRVQYLLAQRIADRWGNIAVVGDDDQSIYGWRGADVGNILTFKDKFKGAHVVKLEQNYRSTSLILDAAGSIIKRNAERMEKTLWTAREGGEPVRLHAAANEEEEAHWIAARLRELLGMGEPPASIAVLYRAHAQSRPIEEALLDSGLPYAVFGGLRFYERREVKDVLAYLRLTVNPSDPVAFYRVINNPPRGIGDRTLERIAEEASLAGEGLAVAARRMVDAGLLGGRAAKAVGGFLTMIEGWGSVAEVSEVRAMLETILDETGYRKELEKEKDGRGVDRLENIEELVNAAASYDKEDSAGVAGFLDRAALVSDMDRSKGVSSVVTLMTIHSAKGLEYPTVFLTGMEEGVFPHALSMGSPEEVEEERRLCYVAMTRAKERLFLTRSGMRRVYGAMSEARLPSRFLDELPPELRPPKARYSSFASQPSPHTFRSPERARAEPTWSEAPLPQSSGEGGRYFLPEPEEAHYKTGMFVRHSRYGAGRVIEVSGDGPKARLTVAFADGATRKFVAGPAALEIRLDA